MHDAREVLIYLDIYCGHDWDKMYEAISSKNMDILSDEDAKVIIEASLYSLMAEGYKVCVLTDDEYPTRIKSSAKPPFVLYYKGDLDTAAERYSYKLPDADPDRMFIE